MSQPHRPTNFDQKVADVELYNDIEAAGLHTARAMSGETKSRGPLREVARWGAAVAVAGTLAVIGAFGVHEGVHYFDSVIDHQAKVTDTQNNSVYQTMTTAEHNGDPIDNQPTPAQVHADAAAAPQVPQS